MGQLTDAEKIKIAAKAMDLVQQRTPSEGEEPTYVVRDRKRPSLAHIDGYVDFVALAELVLREVTRDQSKASRKTESEMSGMIPIVIKPRPLFSRLYRHYRTSRNLSGIGRWKSFVLAMSALRLLPVEKRRAR